jgi:NAD(P)-dependent dehydrogenase (short-subunit alcohol dehydrogenase family)
MSFLNVEGKRFIITGAASGIGRATAILLSQLGATTVLVDKNKEGLEITRDRCENGCKLLHCDLTTDKIDKSIFEGLDGFVHCAGIAYISPLKAISKEQCNKVWEINTWVAIELSKNFARYSKHGSIVYISSAHAIVGAGSNTGYAASKAALHGITKSLAIELAPKIRVNCIAVGWVNTEMADKVVSMFGEGYVEGVLKTYPLGLGKPDDVANCIIFMLSDASRWMTGTIINVDGGHTAQ